MIGQLRFRLSLQLYELTERDEIRLSEISDIHILVIVFVAEHHDRVDSFVFLGILFSDFL